MAWGPVKGFVRPSLIFVVAKVSCILTTCPCFNNFEVDIFEAGGPSATSSCLLPLQLGFEHFEYITLS